MSQYTRLAEYYDILTAGAGYEAMARRLCVLLQKCRIPVRLVLELACGTGTVSRKLSQAGYEMLSADSSADMLAKADEKFRGLDMPPVIICQDMLELDLYGTVQAAVCCLDSLNYLEDTAQLQRAFDRVSLFMEQGGRFIFDMKSADMFAQMGGSSSVFEGDNFFCAWQYGYDPQSKRAQHTVDIFEASGDRYRRCTEQHFQRAFSRLQVETALDRAKFKLVEAYQGYSIRKEPADTGRLLYVAEKR